MSDKEEVATYIQDQLELVKRVQTILNSMLNDNTQEYYQKHSLLRAVEYRDKALRMSHSLESALIANKFYKNSKQ